MQLGSVNSAASVVSTQAPKSTVKVPSGAQRTHQVDKTSTTEVQRLLRDVVQLRQDIQQTRRSLREGGASAVNAGLVSLASARAAGANLRNRASQLSGSREVSISPQAYAPQFGDSQVLSQNPSPMKDFNAIEAALRAEEQRLMNAISVSRGHAVDHLA